MVLTVMRRRLSVYRVHLHVPRSVSDSLCYLESAWQGMHSSTAVSGGGLCRMIMPDNTSLLSIPARAMLLFLPCGVVPLLLTFDTSACDALVFAVRCRATPACVQCVLLAMPGAGLLGRGRGREVHVVGDRHELALFVRRVRRHGRGAWREAVGCYWGSGGGRHCVCAAGEKHMGGGASTWAGTACVCARGGREAHGWWGIAMSRHCECEAGGGAQRQAGAYIVRPLNSWPS